MAHKEICQQNSYSEKIVNLITMVLPPCVDQQLVAIYVRLEQLHWSLLTQQRRVARLVEQQRKKMDEQEKMIAFLTNKLAAREQVLLNVSHVEDLERCAKSRLPKLDEESEFDARKEREGDEDSAIHLNSAFDSLNSSSSSLQRSVSDVVGQRRRPGKESQDPFPSDLYRGFLLRHQKKPRLVNQGTLSSEKSLYTTVPVEKGNYETKPKVRNQSCKTTILIKSEASRE